MANQGSQSSGGGPGRTVPKVVQPTVGAQGDDLAAGVCGEILQQFQHFLLDLLASSLQGVRMRAWRITQAGGNSQKPGMGFVQFFSPRAVPHQGAIDLLDQEAKVSVPSHWHGMQNLSNGF